MKRRGLPPGEYGNTSGYQPHTLTNKDLSKWRSGTSAGNPACMVLLVKEIDALRKAQKQLIALVRLNQELIAHEHPLSESITEAIESTWNEIPLSIRASINDLTPGDPESHRRFSGSDAPRHGS